MIQKLHKKFLSARSKGLRISHAWFYANANRINKEVNGSEATRLPKSSVTRFIRTYKIKLRRVQRKKQANKTNYLPAIMRWHTTLRERLIKTGKSSPNYNEKWGRFKPNRRFKCRSCPLAFRNLCQNNVRGRCTRENKRNHRVWVANPGPGPEKRQCTLKICISPESKVRHCNHLPHIGKENPKR